MNGQGPCDLPNFPSCSSCSGGIQPDTSGYGNWDY